MARIAFYVHPTRPEAAALAERATAWLTGRGHEVMAALAPDELLKNWIAFGGYRSGATPPNPCLTMQPPPTTGCDPPGPEHIAVSEAAVALPVP